MATIIKFVLTVTTCIVVCQTAKAQPIRADQHGIDSVQQLLAVSKADTQRVMLLNTLAGMNLLKNTDLARQYAEEGEQLAQKLGFKKGEVISLSHQAFAASTQGNLVKGMDIAYRGIELSEKYYPQLTTEFYLRLHGVYDHQSDYQNANIWIEKALQLPQFKTAKGTERWAVLMLAGVNYLQLNQLDNAQKYAQESYDVAKNKALNLEAASLQTLGRIEAQKGNYPQAVSLIHQASEAHTQVGSYAKKCENDYFIAETYLLSNQLDSALMYGTFAFEGSKKYGNKIFMRDASALLAKVYQDRDVKKAYGFLMLSNVLRDSIINTAKLNQMRLIEYKDKKAKDDLLTEKRAHNGRLRQNILLCLLATFGIISFFLWRNNKQKQKAKMEIEQAYKKLKTTQNQLVQKEKLASLGELTAGIAHEIQNPLNFVNNFSELSVDLAKDLNDEIHKPDIDKDYIEELLTDLTSNQEKINHHGKRASSIVKGMLEHSRASTGVKEWVDINKLADEYLRLSYHGLRAKDKSFNADFKTEFDENLPKIEVIPQDIGRVFLNLINNAFYAVNEKSKQNTEGGYKPTVLVSTQQLDNQVIIKVKDNGTGMPESVSAKVFQPFFTTKPTGQGTGLGLSLAYDVVTKGHGGTLEVVSTEGTGSEFIIRLPNVL